MARKRGEVGEFCRRLVVKLFGCGKTPQEAAERVELSPSAVSRIWKRFNESREEGLAPQNSPGATVPDFLRCLAPEIDYPLGVGGDNASIHRAPKVKAFLREATAGRIPLVAPPSYSPVEC